MATTNYGGHVPGILCIPFVFSGQRTASVTAIARFTLPFAASVLGVQATARASGGTTPTLTVDIMEGGTTLLSTPVAVTAGAVADAVVTDSALADEAAMTINLAIGGTNPTWDDIMVLLTLMRN